MRLFAPALLLAACSGPPAPTEEGTDPAVNPVPKAPTEASLLKAGPPELGPAGRAVTALAAELDLAVARCPVSGAGRTVQGFGTPRDALRKVGPPWLLEVTPEDAKPWNTAFDVVPIEESWVALLAEPGSTGSVVTAGDRRLKMTWTAAKKGETVVCTAVEELGVRVVTGAVEARPGASVGVVGCTEGPEPVAGDGTFVVDALAPCVMWLESDDAHRTNRVVIEAGTEKRRIDSGTFTWTADTLQDPDRQWTPEGKKALRRIIREVEDDIIYVNETLGKVAASLGDDEPARRVTEHWGREVASWSKHTKLLQVIIDG